MRILSEGTLLAGRYRLVRRLGGGGMSEVWLADDRQGDGRVALKFLAGNATGDARAKDLLQREWRLGSRLMHANIIRVFEFHDDPEGAFFSLQFVGETTIGVLAGKDPSESLRPVGLIADALRYAHGKGVVHRDIKAANILLDSRGAPYLVDFGVAATVGSDAVSGSGSGVAMSPEQQAGGAARPADDIFGLGVLIHELLTGAPPGDGETREVSTTMPDGSPVPGALVSLMSDMLHADPASRPDAETVAARLVEAGFPPGAAPARYVSGGVVDAVFEQVEPTPGVRRAPLTPAQPDTSPQKSGGFSPNTVYGALGVALLLFLGVIFVLPALVDDEPEPVADAPPTEQAPDAVDLEAPDASAEDDTGAVPTPSDAAFSENLTAGGIKAAADEALGDLLSQLERLRYRAIERWGGQEYLDAVNVYSEGDQAYVDKNYRLAGEKYREAIRRLEPFFDRIDGVFEETLAEAKAAFERADPVESVRLYDLAVAITPGNREAEAGLERAKNLEAVLSLIEQGSRYEADLEYDAARLAFEKALELDPLWEPAAVALERIRIAIKNLSFEQRMTEGFEALMAGDFDSARAAFNAARLLNPNSREPADGLLQVEQEMKLSEIRRLEATAAAHDQAEEWETSIVVYQDILKIDPDLQFAQQGLGMARNRAAIHARLQGYIDDPDNLSDDANMQNATRLLLDVARIDPMGPRLEDQKNELSRLLKRASTPLSVQLVSDGLTEVSVFKIGRFGVFMAQDLELRPGNYVAVGIRPGYRDVRVEFRVAPEIDMQPVVVVCQEPI
jgi:tetratricopeptide (TPR) repeat protein